MLPSLTYSQYPKQTIINGDSVVIMTTKQAVKMNQVFIGKNNIIRRDGNTKLKLRYFQEKFEFF